MFNLYPPKCVYTLQTDKETLGVYTSMQELSKAIDYWMVDPRCVDKTFHYSERGLDTNCGVFCWGWAYIPVSACRKTLSSGGAFVYPKKYWGQNILKIPETVKSWEYEQYEKRLEKRLDREFGKKDKS